MEKDLLFPNPLIYKENTLKDKTFFLRYSEAAYPWCLKSDLNTRHTVPETHFRETLCTQRGK